MFRNKMAGMLSPAMFREDLLNVLHPVYKEVPQDQNFSPFQRMQNCMDILFLPNLESAVHILQDACETAPVEVITRELPDILNFLMQKILAFGNASDILQKLAAISNNYSERIPDLRFVNDDHIIPMLVDCITKLNSSSVRFSSSAICHMLARGLISKQQVEIKICPVILSLLNPDPNNAKISADVINLMCKLSLNLGSDITNRVFKDRFIDFCSSKFYYIRRECAANLHIFFYLSDIVTITNIWMPLFIKLCSDDIWGVRKACAEISIHISALCPMEVRRTILTQLLLKLMNDECKWIAMTAYKTLGPFIATFAKPSITNVVFNSDLAELTFVDIQGTELPTNSPTFADITLDEVASNLIITKAQADAVFLTESKSDDWSTDFDDDKSPIDNCSRSKDNSYDCDLEKYNNYHFWYVPPDSTKIDLKLFDQNLKLNISECIETDLHTLTSVNAIKCEDPINDQDPLQYHANITQMHDVKGDVSPSTSERLLGKTEIERSNISELGDQPFVNKHYEENDPHGGSISIEPSSEMIINEQCIVPHALIDRYIYMPHLNWDIKFVGANMSLICAYSLPAVVVTLGPTNWHIVRQTFHELAFCGQSCVRKTIAASLHKLASILGTDIATKDLAAVFNRYVKDSEEVRWALLPNLSSFLINIKPLPRANFLSQLFENAVLYRDDNWRVRQELTKQLIKLAPQLPKSKTLKDLLECVADILLDDKIWVVRREAILLVTKLAKISKIQNQWLIWLGENYCASDKWRRRQTFAFVCYSVLANQAMPNQQFNKDLLRYIIQLSYDRVPNVRLVVARIFARFLVSKENITQLNNGDSETLNKAIEALQTDTDSNVQEAALGIDTYMSYF